MTGIYWIEFEKPRSILNEGEIEVAIPIPWNESPTKVILAIARNKFGSDVVSVTQFVLKRIENNQSKAVN